MDTNTSRDVPAPVLEFDSGISLVIAVKMPRSHENHVQIIGHNFGTVGDSPWPKVKLSDLL